MIFVNAQTVTTSGASRKSPEKNAVRSVAIKVGEREDIVRRYARASL